MCSCHSIPECCVTFSGVKLSIRSFVLSQLCEDQDIPEKLKKHVCNHMFAILSTYIENRLYFYDFNY